VKSKILFISLAVVLSLSLGLIGCGGEELPPEAPDSIKVGMARDLDGLLSVFECGYAGVSTRYMVNKINAEGGIYLSDYAEKVPIELIVRDFDLATWDIAAVTEALIDTDECDFIFGGPGTDCIFTQAPVCNSHATVYIGMEGGSASMIWDGDIDNWPYVFPSLAFSTWYQMPVLHSIMQEVTGKENPVVYMTYIGGAAATHGIEYSEACKISFGEDYFIDGGFHDYDLFETGAASAVVSAAQAALGDPANPNYDLCILQSYPWNTAALTIALLGSDFNPPAIMMGPGAMGYEYPAGFGAAAVEGVMCYAVATEEQSPELAQMYDDLAVQVEADWADPDLTCEQGTYTSGHDQLDVWGNPCYVAGIEMWAQAVENAGNLDSIAVRDELVKFSSTNPCDTVLGDTWFYIFGDGQGGGMLDYKCHPGEILQWQSGVAKIIGYDGVESVIPAYDATGDLTYPMTDQWAWLLAS
jgi:hypothetical protein